MHERGSGIMNVEYTNNTAFKSVGIDTSRYVKRTDKRM